MAVSPSATLFWLGFIVLLFHPARCSAWRQAQAVSLVAGVAAALAASVGDIILWEAGKAVARGSVRR